MFLLAAAAAAPAAPLAAPAAQPDEGVELLALLHPFGLGWARSSRAPQPGRSSQRRSPARQFRRLCLPRSLKAVGAASSDAGSGAVLAPRRPLDPPEPWQPRKPSSRFARPPVSTDRSYWPKILRKPGGIVAPLQSSPTSVSGSHWTRGLPLYFQPPVLVLAGPHWT